MMLDADHPLNQGVLRYLGREEKSMRPALAAAGSVPMPYLTQGSHPDIVQRIWDELGQGLTRKCRCLVYGTPALVQERSGIVLAICNGTQYNLRLTMDDFRTALAKGAKTRNRWSNGTEMDALTVLGSEWIFGGWFGEEVDWCRNSHGAYGPPQR